jgi:hypothetical protein
MKSIVPVLDVNGQPISGASVRLNTGPNLFVTATTGQDGTANLVVDDSLEDTQFEIVAAGFQPYSRHIDLGLKGNLQLRVGIGADPNRPEDLVLPPLERAKPPMPQLVIRGRDFIDMTTNERVVLNGCDQFCALRMFIENKPLDDLLDESATLGFNVWRVFGQGSKQQNQIMDLRPSSLPNYLTAVRDFATLLNTHGIIPLFTVFVDNQDVKSPVSLFTDVAEALSTTTALLSGGNEFPKNGFDPTALPNPGVPFWSRGSNLGDASDGPPKPNGATFSEWHPRRDHPKALDDTIASATNIFFTRKFNVPLVIDEPPRMGTDGSDALYTNPAICEQFARGYAVLCAGAVFHSRAGQRGVPMDDQTRACAQAWIRGLRVS